MSTIVVRATAGVEAESVTAPAHAAVRPTAFRQQYHSQAVYRTGAAPADIDALVYATRTLAAGASDDLNLADGSLRDVDNFPVALAVLKLFCVQILSGTGLVVGNAPANPHPLWFGGPGHTLGFDATAAPLLMGSAAGKPVTAAARVVRVANPGPDAVTYLLSAAGLKA